MLEAHDLQTLEAHQGAGHLPRYDTVDAAEVPPRRVPFFEVGLNSNHRGELLFRRPFGKDRSSTRARGERCASCACADADDELATIHVSPCSRLLDCKAPRGPEKDMELYTYFRSTAAYRVRIALNLKGLDYRGIPLQLLERQHKSQDYLAKNPQGLVPALQDGAEVIPQSLAILEYLEETHPTPALLPEQPAERAQVRAMALSIACDIHPLNNLRVLQYLKGTLNQQQSAVNDWYAHWIGEGFRGLEQMIRASGDGQHCFGHRPTLADVCLTPQVYNARRFDVDLTPFPTIVAVDAALMATEPFARAAPEAQPDAPT